MAARYTSKHASKVKAEAAAVRNGAGAMGPKREKGAPAVDPQKYMKKQEGGGAGARVQNGARAIILVTVVSRGTLAVLPCLCLCLCS